MGLDIVYWEKIRISNVQGDEDREDGDLRQLHHGERSLDVPSGWYETEGGGGFRVGTYSSYNEWREWLTTLAYGSGVKPEQLWHGQIKKGPFYELINFSDCEGLIGPSVCAKLAEDFEDWSQKAHKDERVYYTQIYDRFHEAMKTAAGYGAVEFC